MKRTLNGEGIQCLKMLKHHRRYFDKQTLRTLKGQIISGDIEGFRRGFTRLLERG